MSLTVTDVPELSRYEARVDGELAGFADYLRKGHIVVFTHTEVDPNHQGQGVAGTIAREVLDDVRRRDLRALLRCPFLSEWVTHHPEYADVLAHREAGSDAT
jgi:predicted GNAT family acetyltransferase